MFTRKIHNVWETTVSVDFSEIKKYFTEFSKEPDFEISPRNTKFAFV